MRSLTKMLGFKAKMKKYKNCSFNLSNEALAGNDSINSFLAKASTLLLIANFLEWFVFHL